jgi:hypothetical protein
LSTEHIKDIAHAIEGHRFSANITVNSLEAMVVQDAYYIARLVVGPYHEWHPKHENQDKFWTTRY